MVVRLGHGKHFCCSYQEEVNSNAGKGALVSRTFSGMDFLVGLATSAFEHVRCSQERATMCVLLRLLSAALT